jgi:hypothetical protein
MADTILGLFPRLAPPRERGGGRVGLKVFQNMLSFEIGAFEGLQGMQVGIRLLQIRRRLFASAPLPSSVEARRRNIGKHAERIERNEGGIVIC